MSDLVYTIYTFSHVLFSVNVLIRITQGLLNMSFV